MAVTTDTLLAIHDGERVNGRIAFKLANQGHVKSDKRAGKWVLTASGKEAIADVLKARQRAVAKAEENASYVEKSAKQKAPAKSGK